MDMVRVNNEHAGLRRLAQAFPKIISFDVSPNRREYVFHLNVAAPVGTDDTYQVVHEHELTMLLPDDYPAGRPLLRFNHPILVPNVWEDGEPCILHYYVPSMGLDQLLCDVVEEMQGLNPNFGSVANESAGYLFQQPGFVEELRRRLGPPVRIAPPSEQPAILDPATISVPITTAAPRSAGPIMTTTLNTAAVDVVRSGISTASRSTTSPAAITTVRDGRS